jgi:hypothetical protein
MEVIMKHETVHISEHHHEEAGGKKLMGGFLVALGVIFLLGSSGISILGFNPWILMALLPVYWVVAVAYRHYQEDGHISRRVIAPLVFGLLPLAYAGAAILGLNVASIWPIGLIAAGVYCILMGGGK